MPGGTRVVAATVDDAALLHALTQAAWQGTVAPDSSAFRETPRTLVDLFASGGGAFLLWVDDTPLGAVRWVPVAHTEPTWEIKRMGIPRPARGVGHGARLAAAVEAAARVAGIRRLQLGVRADQPRLRDFWLGLGFRPDDSVTLSSHNPATAPPITLSRLLRDRARSSTNRD
jgi:GNAT superfamily N-acetyltransferase